ncbi:hypothetical protein ATO6_14480 [Oceanicola sp. 22II-s10i]|uniref:hypothetical protein n=1 Tax=Oceanicola sp. 22II-s10i TaxID=1317116 RepID=UPI000B528266|nr:hypothetical protein [Oceanicola sp. 22II-s10i]OWU84238.1 hypothetical protein ATO6_14480 [Oceanicola sp. 22II-s10i]
MHDQVRAIVLNRARGFLSLANKSDQSFEEIEPAIVLYTFACELSLKGLGASSGHDLFALYRNLSEDRKAWLQEKYAERTGLQLSEQLTRHGKLFVNVRYYHEGGGFAVNLKQLKGLTEFLCEMGQLAIRERTDQDYTAMEQTKGP